MTTLVEQVPDLNQCILETYERERRIYPVRSNRASELGHPCLRYLVYLRKDWERRMPPSAERLLLFEAGEYIEKMVIKRLERSGFNVVQQQRDFEDIKTQITGHVDGMLEIVNGRAELYPLEVKGLNQFSWAKIHDVADLANSGKSWLMKYPAQLQMYMFLSAKEQGVFCLVNKSTLAMKFIWVTIDVDLVDGLLEKAMQVNGYLEGNDYPDRIEFEEGVCGHCDFQHICIPDLPVGKVEVVDSEELAALMAKYLELRPVVKEYEDADEQLKDVAKAMKGEALVAGDYELRRKLSVRKYPPMPAREVTVVTKTVKKVG